MEQEKAYLRRALPRFVLRLLVLGGISWIGLTQVFLLTRAGGNDMFPAVKDGDLLLAFRLQRSLAQNDVVVYSAGGKTRVGRILASGGDVVYLDGSGRLLVNGTEQTGEILYPTYPKEGLNYPLSIPEGQVFVLGDYRTQGKDSRDFGPVPREEILGKVITLLRRRGL